MKLRTLIVEDHKDARDLLIFLCEPIREIEIISAVDNLDSAKQIFEAEHPDLIFLDVALKGGDGFELLAVLDRKAYPFSLIFTSANPEHAIKAIKEAADDYLLKPISSTELRKSISNIIQKKYYLTNGKKNILISSIIYIRSRGNHVEYHCEGRTQPYVERGSLSALLESLPSVQFVRVHRTFVVNRSHILEVNQSSLLLTKIQRIPVGETYLGSI